jgi:hypothetical protein
VDSHTYNRTNADAAWQIQDTEDISVSWRIQGKWDCSIRSGWRGTQRSDEETKPHGVLVTTNSSIKPPENVPMRYIIFTLLSPKLLIILLGQIN